eukprot:gi/632970666/ref/XP_007901776.1/ PREDICTED: ribosomal RNA processing protein 1 homolog B [Callorhinchus milii]
MAAAAELQFAQRLASNEKRCRDRALSKLRRYLSARSQPSSVGFTREELLKIWKGIFYCMWMQDKPLLQEQLAKNIAQLVHAFQNLDAKFLFMETFCQTMNREWNGIDRLRLDKFYTLIRQVLRQFLQEVRSSGWEDSLVSRFLDCLTAEVLNPAGNSAPNGVRYHFIDIYLEELATVGAQELSAEQNLKFIDPFCCIAAKTKDRVLLHSITHGIFELIVDQAPFAVEDLMKELERSEGVDDSSEDQASDSDLDEPVLGKSAAKHINGAREELAESECSVTMGAKSPLDRGEDEEENLDLPSDEDVGPVLQFDYTAIAGRLFELASKSKTAAANRKRLYKLVKKFKDLAEGIFPHDALSAELSTDEDDEEDFEWRKRKKRKAAAEERQRKKERKEEDVQEVDSPQPREERVEESAAPKQPAAVRRKKKKQRIVRRASDGAEVVVAAVPGGHGTEQRPETLTITTAATAKVIGAESTQSPAEASGHQDSVQVETQTLVVKRRKKKQKAKAVLLNGNILAGASEQSPQSPAPQPPAPQPPAPQQHGPKAKLHHKKLKSKRKVSSLALAAGPGKRRAPPLGTRGAKKLKPQSNGDPMRKAQTPTPDSDFVTLQSAAIPRSLFLRRAQGANHTTQPGHKVTMVSSQFKRTDRSLLVSPEGTSRVAFDPQQKPRCGVLKALASPSPQCGPRRARPRASEYF